MMTSVKLVRWFLIKKGNLACGKCQRHYQKPEKVLASGRDPRGKGDRQERGAKLVWHSASNEWQPLKTCEPSLASEPKPNCGMRAHQLSRSKDFYTFNALSSGLILSAQDCRGMVPACNMPLLGCHRGCTWHWSRPGRVVGRENGIFRLQSRPAATSRERVLITQDVEGLEKKEVWLTGPGMTAFPPRNQRQYDTPRESMHLLKKAIYRLNTDQSNLLFLITMHREHSCPEDYNREVKFTPNAC